MTVDTKTQVALTFATISGTVQGIPGPPIGAYTLVSST
jgi:hypothetical protein